MTMMIPRRKRLNRDSVTMRLFDLLEILDWEWYTIQALQNEYSAHYGPVKAATLRRAVSRELDRDNCVLAVRRRFESPPPPGGPRIEVTALIVEEEEA